MKLFYICSPYSGTKEEIVRNKTYAKELTREILLQNNCAVTPHLYMTDCLDDFDEQERWIGMQAARALLYKCDLVVVGARYGISKGMGEEIERARKYGIPVIYLHVDRRKPEIIEERTVYCNGKEKEQETPQEQSTNV